MWDSAGLYCDTCDHLGWISPLDVWRCPGCGREPISLGDFWRVNSMLIREIVRLVDTRDLIFRYTEFRGDLEIGFPSDGSLLKIKEYLLNKNEFADLSFFSLPKLDIASLAIIHREYGHKTLICQDHYIRPCYGIGGSYPMFSITDVLHRPLESIFGSQQEIGESVVLCAELYPLSVTSGRAGGMKSANRSKRLKSVCRLKAATS